MKVLHTSDWHLGRNFGEFSLLPDQTEFIDWLVGVVAREDIDLVVVAGDLFDRAVPPVAAVSLFSHAVRKIRDAGAQIIAIAGNHDSAERVGAHDGLVGDGIIIRGGYEHAADVTMHTIAGTEVAIIATPFLDPLMASAELRSELQDGTETNRRLTHEQVLANALAQARTEIPDGVPSIVLSHAFVTGASASASERELAVGDAAMVSASVFADFDYVALGHLHRPQTVGGYEHIRYSGSPLPYSFSETHDKVVTLVDFDNAGVVSVSELPVTVGRRVRTVRGTFDELIAPTVSDGDSEPVEVESGWVRAELTDPAIVVDAHRRLRHRFPHLVEIARVSQAKAAASLALTPELIRSQRPALLAVDFWAEITGDAADDKTTSLLEGALAQAERSLAHMISAPEVETAGHAA